MYYGFFWAAAIVIVLIREFSEDGNGHLADNVRVTFYMETITILLTVISVPLALKLFAWILQKRINQVELQEAMQEYRKWSLVRLILLFVPVLAGLATYYFTFSTTGALCAAIALTASLFCVPTEESVKRELKIVD